MSEISRQTIEAMEDLKILLKVGEWGFDTKDAGKLVIKLNQNGDIKAIMDHVFLTIVRGERDQYCTSLKKIFKGKEDLINNNSSSEFTIPLPVKLMNDDRVRFFTIEGGQEIRQFTVCLKETS